MGYTFPLGQGGGGGSGAEQDLFTRAIPAGDLTAIDIAVGFTFKTGLFMIGSLGSIINRSKQAPMGVMFGRWLADGFAYPDIPHPNNTSMAYEQNHAASGFGGADPIWQIVSQVVIPAAFGDLEIVAGLRGLGTLEGGEIRMTRVKANQLLEMIALLPERVTSTTLRLNIDSNSWTDDVVIACLMHS